MWKLPDGRIINRPKGVTIDGIQHPADIFLRWSPEALNAIGIFPYRELKFDNKYYTSAGHDDVIVDGCIVRTHTLQHRYSVLELKQKFAVIAKKQLRTLWETADLDCKFLEAFDETNTEAISALWQYKEDLKTAFRNAKQELKEIITYEYTIEFIERGFKALLPTRLDNEEEDPE